jgi:hypothetical protein
MTRGKMGFARLGIKRENIVVVVFHTGRKPASGAARRNMRHPRRPMSTVVIPTVRIEAA